MTARARFEQNLVAWVVQFEATTRASDPLWSRTFDLQKRAWNLRTRNIPAKGGHVGVLDLRMRRLHQKLDSGLNILVGQAAQRQKFLAELRAIKNSN
jgi:hypothetical protein